MKTPRPVLIMSSVLAGLNVFVAGTAFVDAVPKWVSGLAALFVASVIVGWGVYVQGQVVPLPLVAAHVDTGTGATVAGPAAPGVDSHAVDSTNVGDVVDVTKAETWRQP